MPQPSVYDHVLAKGYNRRDFLKLCAAVAGAMGLGVSPLGGGPMNPSVMLLRRVAEALQSSPRLPVIWLELQDCAGCTMALTRSSNPTLVDLLFETISLDYHETLAAGWGADLEAYRDSVIERYEGQYVLVVEGSVPAVGGACTVGGRAADDLLREAAAGAKHIVATGSCASFGGIPSARPNPTTATSVSSVLSDRIVVNVPGCPAIPEVTTGTLAHLIVNGGPPELDDLGRPLPYYGSTIHERCERLPHYRRGEFAKSFDDEGALQGWCLFELGCKGPETYNACPTMWWGDLSFPVQSGHPCLGCSQPGFWDRGFYQWHASAYLPRVEIGG